MSRVRVTISWLSHYFLLPFYKNEDSIAPRKWPSHITPFFVFLYDSITHIIGSLAQLIHYLGSNARRPNNL